MNKYVYITIGSNFHVSLLLPTLNAALPTKISLQQGDCNCGEGIQVQLCIQTILRSCKSFTVECRKFRRFQGVILWILNSSMAPVLLILSTSLRLTPRLPKWPFKAFRHAKSTVATKPWHRLFTIWCGLVLSGKSELKVALVQTRGLNWLLLLDFSSY